MKKMPVFFLIIGVILISFFIFSFLYFILPSLSPIPFFPTNQKDLPLIVKNLIKAYPKYDLIVDLGAGTGTVIFAAAHEAYRKKLATRFLALEIHPLLIIIMYIKRLFFQNKQNIHIARGDILKMDYQIINSQFKSENPCIYLYIGHLVIEKIKKKLLTLSKETTIVSYMYDIPGWTGKLVAKSKGVHDLYTYRL